MHFTVIFSSLTFEQDYNKIVVVADDKQQAMQRAILAIENKAVQAGYDTIVENDCITIIDDAGDVVNEFFNFRIE